MIRHIGPSRIVCFSNIPKIYLSAIGPLIMAVIPPSNATLCPFGCRLDTKFNGSFYKILQPILSRVDVEGIDAFANAFLKLDAI